MAMFSLTTPVTALSGVGTARQKALAALQIETVGDLIHHLPRGYQDRRPLSRLCDCVDGQTASVILCVGTPVVNARLRGRLVLSRLKAYDDSASCTITYFGQPYVKDMLELGKEYRFYGKVKRRKNQIELLSPVVEDASAPLPDFVAVYPLTKGLSSKILSSLIAQALTGIDLTELDPLPREVREAHGFLSLQDALWELHFPTGESGLQAAQNRMVYAELFLFSLCVAAQNRRRTAGNACNLSPTEADMATFLQALPYTPTGAQLRAISEIANDLTAQNGLPMSRLLNGDVGSGKTLCAAAAAYFAMRAHTQCAMMAPTEILATQHYQTLSPLFAAFGFRTALLCASMKAPEKRDVLRGLQSGEIGFVVGTHAILTESVTFANLGLVITDEQHRFGIFQRTALAEKGRDPHLLVMSATPIPRTLALILYGDLSLSTLDEMPPGRQVVDTFLVSEDYRARLQAFIAKQVAAGGQVYIVCPSIEPAKESAEEQADFAALGGISHRAEMKNVTDYAKELQKALPQLRVGMLHGKLPSAKKEDVMRQFVDGQIQVLVATTVIEVGVNVPRATLMIIENAERFGLAQLHQLRGRVGRGNEKSYCVLVSDAKEELARTRLKTLCDCRDGYEIAKQDLKLRGPGDFFPDTQKGAARQSGQPLLRFAALCDNMQLLQDACNEANDLLAHDADLSLHPATKSARDALLHQQRNTVH